MDRSQYQSLTDVNKELKKNKIPLKLILRQALVCSGAWITCFIDGLKIGTPTVMIPQIEKDANSTIILNPGIKSWMMSLNSIAVLPYMIVLSMLATILGRKKIYICVVLVDLISSIMLYFCTTAPQVIAVQVSNGVITSFNTTVVLFIMGEYTTPKLRSVFATLKSVMLFWGIWTANLIGTLTQWSMIQILAIVCSIYGILIALFWPESPYWLASKKRFEECETSYRWLRGEDNESRKELLQLIDSQKEETENEKFNFKLMLKKEFYKPVLLSLVVKASYVCSGKFVCAVYILEIMKKVTGNEKTAYTAMLVLDGFTVFGMYMGCFLTKRLTRRNLFLGSTSGGVIFLYFISLYLYLVKLEVFFEKKYITVGLLVVYSVTISCGPMLMSSTIVSELLPFKLRSLAIILIDYLYFGFLGSTLKVTPWLLSFQGVHGTFFWFAVSTTICTTILYKFMPETKDTTIQEIEEIFKNK